MRRFRGMFVAFVFVVAGVAAAAWSGSAVAQVAPPSPTMCPITPPPLESGSTPTYPGRFWNPKRYGTGWDFLYDEQLAQDRMFVLYWFTYGADKRPTWLIAWPREVTSTDGHKRYTADLKRPHWTGTHVDNYTTVGSVALTIPNGTSTRAAITWQWNEAGSGPYTECVYDFFRDQMPHAVESTTLLNQAYTANWYDTVLDTAMGGRGSWGFDLVIGIDAAQNYFQIVTPQIFDVDGRPAWVQYGQLHAGMPPKDNTANPGALVYTRSRNGVPVTDCTATDQAQTGACFEAIDLTVGAGSATRNRFFHTFTGPNAAKIAMQVSVSSEKAQGAAIDWPTPGLPARYNVAGTPSVDVVRTTDVDRLVTDRTLCFVQQAGANCPLIVSFTSTGRYTKVYRFNLNDNTALPVQVHASGAYMEGTFTDPLPIGARVKYKLYNDGVTPPGGTPLSESSEVRVIGRVNVADQPLVSLAGDLPSHDARVGTLAGDAGVSGGAATYTIPITVPPGRNGMQPDIALNYSSRSGNGVAGMGFALSGLSSIHRCPRTKAQDGSARAVRLDAQDALCLDGQRLMALSGSTYGVSGARYRTEIDNYTRVTQVGDLGTAGACFLAETKSGRVLHYGAAVNRGAGPTCSTSTANARVQGHGATATLSWLVEKVEDYAGNAMTYAYDNRDPGGPLRETLVRSISYTLPTPQAAQRRVTFDYANRPSDAASNDNAVSALAGGLSAQVKRLTTIATWVGAEKVREYTLAYAKVGGGASLSAYSGRSLLREVKECAYDTSAPGGVCRPATTFDWNDGPLDGKDKFRRLILTGRTAAVVPTPAEIATDYPATVVPLPPDMERPIGSGTSSGSAGPGTTPLDFTIQPLTELPSDVAYYTTIGDVNGDGGREVLARSRTGTDPYKWEIYQTTAGRRFGRAVVIGAENVFGVPGADNYDADGYSDGLRFPRAGEAAVLHLVKWNRARGYWPTSIEGFDQLFATLPTNVPVVIGDTLIENSADFDGDGRPDVLLRRKNATCGAIGYNELAIYRNVITPSAPTAFQAGATKCIDRYNQTSLAYGEEIAHVSDLDGDGRAEIVIATSAPNSRTITAVLVPTADASSFTVVAASQLDLGGDADIANRVVRWMDVNGDGLSDLVFAIQNSGNWKVRLNQGNLRFTARIETANVGDVGLRIGFNGFKYANHLKLTDVDGDGRPEFLRPARLAAALCPMYRETPCRAGSGGGDKPYCDVYACPDDPVTGNRLYRHGDLTLGHYAARLYDDVYPGAAHDPSAYVMHAVRFLIGPPNATTNLPTITAVDTPTSIIGTLSDFVESSDVYGDGLTDQISSIGCSNCAAATSGAQVPLETHLPNGEAVNDLVGPNYSVFLNENTGATRPGEIRDHLPPRLPELLDTAVNGLGDEAVWDYFPLSSDAGRAAGDLPLYTTVANPAASYADDDHFYFTSSMPVVAALYRSNGIGDIVGFRSVRYGYEEAMYNARGRGFQGFRAITQESEAGAGDAARRVRTRTEFHQKFPYTGLVEHSVVSRTSAAAPTTFQPIGDERNQWADKPAVESTKIRQPHLTSSKSERYETDGVCAGSVVATDTTNTGWDDYGNLLGQIVEIKEKPGTARPGCEWFVQTQRTATTNTYANLGEPWWPGQPGSTTVTGSLTYGGAHMPPGGTQPATQLIGTTFGWDAATRALLSNTQTADGGTLTQTTTHAYPAGGGYGLPDSTTVSANGVASRTTTFTYSADRYFAATTTNPLGYTSRVDTRARDGQASVAIDPAGITVATTYDPFGQAIRVDKYKPNANTNLPGTVPMEPPVLTAVQACVSASDCGGPHGDGADGQAFAAYRVTTAKAGAPTQATWHDTLGRVVKRATRGFDPSETTPYLPSSPWVQTLTRYDALGQVAQQSTPHCRAGSPLCAATSPRWTTYAYDAQQRVIAKVAPAPDAPGGVRDIKTTYAYSGGATTITVGNAWSSGSCAQNCLTMHRYASLAGQLMKTVDAKLGAVRYWHDAASRPIVIEDAKGSITRATYDGFGRRLQSIDPNQGTWTFTYDGYGQVLTQTDARGIVTGFVYDALGRMTERHSKQTSSQGALVPSGVNREDVNDTWAYNDTIQPVGALASVGRRVRHYFVNPANQQETLVSDSVPWMETYEFDAAGRTDKIKTNIVEFDGQAAKLFETGIEYDETYNREKVRNYPSGLRVQSTYTAYGQASRMRDADLQQDYVTIVRRDHWGNVAQQMYGNNTAGMFTWNPGSGQSQTRAWLLGGTGGVEVDRFEYGYDLYGNLLHQTRRYPESDRIEVYTYDDLHRLTSAVWAASGVQYGQVNYVYDAVGNLRAKSDYSDALPQPAPPTTVNDPYQYLPGRPNAVSQVKQGGVVRNYGYDANGNLTGGEVQGWYDAQNLSRRLVRSGAASQFDYAPTGQRYRERTFGQVKLMLPFGLERLSERQYRHELGEVVVQRQIFGASPYEGSNTITYNYHDRLGSTAALADGYGTIQPNQRLVYDAFGKPRDGDFTLRNFGLSSDVLALGTTERGFTGHQHLDGPKLIHMNGRAYDYQLGRFLSVDPIIQFPTNSQSLNPYSYIFNNPLSGTDPTGYQYNDGTSICDRSPGSCSAEMVGVEQVAPKIDGRVVRTEGGGIYRASQNPDGSTAFERINKERNGAQAGQGTRRTEQLDGSRGGSADIETASSTPAQQHLGEMKRTAASAMGEMGELIDPCPNSRSAGRCAAESAAWFAGGVAAGAAAKKIVSIYEDARILARFFRTSGDEATARQIERDLADMELGIPLKELRRGGRGVNFASEEKLLAHYGKHGREFGATSPEEYLQIGRDIIDNGVHVKYMYKNQERYGFVQYMGNKQSNGRAKFGFVGLNGGGDITTIHVESGNSFWRMLNGFVEKSIEPVL